MDRRTGAVLVAALAVAGGTSGCSGDAPSAAPPAATAPATVTAPPSTVAPPSPVAPPTTAAPPTPTPDAPRTSAPLSPPASAPPHPSPATEAETIRYRIERRTTDEATSDFADTVQAVLTDRRGWTRAGFEFVVDPDAPYVVVLAEADEVDALCLPMDTFGMYSCQNGPVVALNADRWREATPQWPADVGSYRTMLVNHEVGHLLHLHHPEPQCPGAGLPAPVMAQQSTTLEGCEPNPWPLQWEVDLAAARLEPLAPPPEHVTWDHRPSPPPDRRG